MNNNYKTKNNESEIYDAIEFIRSIPNIPNHILEDLIELEKKDKEMRDRIYKVPNKIDLEKARLKVKYIKENLQGKHKCNSHADLTKLKQILPGLEYCPDCGEFILEYPYPPQHILKLINE